MDKIEFMQKTERMGKWELFKIHRDIAIKKYVKEKRKILGMIKIARHVRYNQVITLIWRRHQNRILAAKRKQMATRATEKIKKQIKKAIIKFYKSDSIE